MLRCASQYPTLLTRCSAISPVLWTLTKVAIAGVSSAYGTVLHDAKPMTSTAGLQDQAYAGEASPTITIAASTVAVIPATPRRIIWCPQSWLIRQPRVLMLVVLCSFIWVSLSGAVSWRHQNQAEQGSPVSQAAKPGQTMTICPQIHTFGFLVVTHSNQEKIGRIWLIKLLTRAFRFCGKLLVIAPVFTDISRESCSDASR